MQKPIEGLPAQAFLTVYEETACFAMVEIEKRPGICYSHSGRTAELFAASMQDKH